MANITERKAAAVELVGKYLIFDSHNREGTTIMSCCSFSSFFIFEDPKQCRGFPRNILSLFPRHQRTGLGVNPEFPYVCISSSSAVLSKVLFSDAVVHDITQVPAFRITFFGNYACEPLPESVKSSCRLTSALPTAVRTQRNRILKPNIVSKSKINSNYVYKVKNLGVLGGHLLRS